MAIKLNSVELTRIGWKDEPDETTPLDSGNLKQSEENVQTAINEVVENSQKAIKEIETLMAKNIMTAYGTKTQEGVSNSTTVALTESISVGDKLTLQNNAIVIGKGISKVKVSGVIYFENLTDAQIYLFPKLIQNSETLLAPITSKANNQFESVTFAEALVEVAEGDKFTLNVGDVNNLKVNVKGNRNATYLTVEAVE
jgi:hypothetical protein|nr:MAG TPA: hypothetical protein [Caudoviricetes sp.]